MTVITIISEGFGESKLLIFVYFESHRKAHEELNYTVFKAGLGIGSHIEQQGHNEVLNTCSLSKCLPDCALYEAGSLCKKWNMIIY